MAKVNITIPDELLACADSFAEKCSLSRSGLISLSLRSYMDAIRFNSMLDSLTACLDRLGTKGNDDPETLAQIERLTSAISLIKQK